MGQHNIRIDEKGRERERESDVLPEIFNLGGSFCQVVVGTRKL